MLQAIFNKTVRAASTPGGFVIVALDLKHWGGGAGSIVERVIAEGGVWEKMLTDGAITRTESLMLLNIEAERLEGIEIISMLAVEQDPNYRQDRANANEAAALRGVLAKTKRVEGL